MHRIQETEEIHEDRCSRDRAGNHRSRIYRRAEKTKQDLINIIKQEMKHVNRKRET